MKIIIRLLIALCLALALIWGAILTATSDRAAMFFKLAETKLEESGMIEKAKEKLARAIDRAVAPRPEPVITEKLIADRPAEINPIVELKEQSTIPEQAADLTGLEPEAYDPIEAELLEGKENNFIIEEDSDLLSARDAIRILETLNIGKE